jgi:hypothetical protein
MVNQFGIEIGTGGIFGGSTSHDYPPLGTDYVLTGTSGVIVEASLLGSFHVKVASSVPGSPQLECNIAKNQAYNLPSVGTTHYFNSTDGTKIEVIWGANQFIQVRKSSANFNGIYTILVY